MSVIDNRIVEMQFNNKQFESGVRESMGTIDKLKQSLNFRGAEKGLSELASAFGKIDLSPLSGAVEAAGAKFSWLEQIAIGACRKIGEELATTLKNYTTELTTKQIGEGWTKYADKTTSVQTILAATGDSMEKVNEQLDKLNWFTDETSYNFVDMVNNIGKFTSNGIKLETSVTAMQGIANWAAISGQNAQAASRAMYNLAQAIGTGSVKLIDWKSIENANMATQEFKQKVLEVAAAQGTLKKQSDGTYKTLKGTAVSVQNFNSALSEGWFTKNVLMKTLDAYGSVTNKIYELSEASGLTATDILQLVDAQKQGKNVTKELQRALKTDDVKEYEQAIKELAKSENDFGIKTFKAAQEAKTFQDAIDATKDAVSTGWMKTFELIFGDYEHAKVLWTDFANNLYDIFAAGGEARNELLSEWGNSGWDNLSDKLKEAGVSAGEFEQALLESADLKDFDLKNYINQYGSLTEAAKAGAFELDVIQKALNKVSKSTKSSTKTVQDQVLSYEKLDELGKKMRSGELGGWDGGKQLKELKKMGYTEEQAKIIQKYAQESHRLGRSLSKSEAEKYLKKLNKEKQVEVKLTEDQIKARKELENYDLEDFFDEEGPKMVADIINNIFQGIIDTLNLVKETWHEFFGSMTAKRLKEITADIRDFTAAFALFKETEEGDVELTERGEKIKAALELIFGVFKNVLGIFRNVARIFKQFVDSLTPVWEALSRFGRSVLLLFTSITGKANNFLSRLDFSSTFQSLSETIAKAIDWVTEKVDKLRETFDNTNFSEKLETVKTKITNIKTAVANLLGINSEANSETENTMSTFEKLGKVLDAVTEFFSPVTDFFSNLWGDMQGIFDFSQVTNIADFVKAVVEGLIATLGALWNGLMSGVENLGITFGDAIKMFLGWKVGNRILSAVLKDGKKGFGALADSIGEIIDQVKEKGIIGLITGGSEKKGGGFKELATSLLMVGGALLMIAAALAIVASIKVEKLAKAFTFLIGTLAAGAGIILGLGAALKKLNINSLQLIGAAAALMILGVALLFLAGSIAVFTLVQRMEGVWKGLGLMAASLAVVALALGILAKTCSGVKLLLAATAILVTSAALIALAGALALFTLVANMDGTTKALITLAVTLGVVVVALMALATAGPMVLVGAASLAVASLAIIGLAVAIGILALVMPLLETGLTALGNGILGLTTGVCESIALVISTIATGIVEIGNGISEAISSLGSGIGEALTAISTGIADLGTGAGAAIKEVGTGIGEAAKEILTGVGAGVEELGNGIGAALEGVSTGIIAIGFSVGKAITWVGTGISNALSSVGIGIAQAGMGIGAAFTFIGTGIGNALEIAFGGLGSGISELGAGISDAIKSIGDGVMVSGMYVGAAFGFIGAGIGNALELALGGLGAGISELGSGIGEAISGIGTGISEAGSGIGTALEEVGQGIGLGIQGALGGIGTGIEEIGKGVAKGFAYAGWGIATANRNIGKSIEELGSSIGTGFESAGSGISTSIETVSLAISEFGTSLSGTITDVSNSLSEGITEISTSVDEFAGSISNVGSGLTDVGTGISDIAGGISEIVKLSPDLVASANGLNEVRISLRKYGVDASLITQAAAPIIAISSALTNLSTVNQGIGNAGNALKGIGDIFAFLNSNTKKGVLQNAENIKNSITTLVQSIIESFSGLQVDFGTIAANAITNFSNGISEGSSVILSQLVQLVNGMNNNLRTCITTFYNLGKYAAIGFNNGMVSMQGTIMANAAKIGAAAATALRNALKVKSPSRVFAEIGRFTVMGFSKGIEDNEGQVINSVTSLADTLVNSMQTAMAYAQDQSFGINPSITPVLDMNNMSGQVDAFNTILSGFNMQGMMANANIDGATINNTIQSRDIVNEIHQLNERMAIMDENLQNMQVVLDTGVLVGQTSAKMDNQFGLMAMRKGRGN